VPRSRPRGSALLRLGAVLATLIMAPARASSQEPERRPELPRGADPASAQAYYDQGVELLRRDPRTAAEMFRWASRLDPEWAEPYEGRRAAVMIAQQRGLQEYFRLSRRVEAFRLADSLRLQASMRNPLQLRPFEGEVVLAAIRATARSIDPTEVFDPAELEYYLEQGYRSNSLQLRAMLAYSNHELPIALDLYEEAVERADSLNRGGYMAERAHVLAVAGRYEDARVEYDSALTALRKVDEEIIYIYFSKALQLYSMGLMDELLENPARAREDYEGALAEDLSFHPAHLGLARLSLAAGDTTNALFSYRMAADLAPDDPTIRMKLAGLLVASGDPAGAETEIRAAIAANGDYAAPHLVIGALAERGGRPAEAVTHYERYLALAPRADRNRAAIQNRVAALKAAAGGGEP
jgi:tetratricopeptide (TPR) repeat protein